MGGGKSKSKQKQGGKFKQEVFESQIPALENLYQQAGDLFGNLNQAFMGGGFGGMQGVTEQMQPYWKQQMGGGAYQGMPLQSMYQQALQGGGAEQDINEMIMGGAGNDYVDAMRDQMRQTSMEDLGQQLGALDARAAAANMSGGSRHGIAQGRAIEGAQDALTEAQTRLGYDTFDKDLNRKLDIARRADQFDQAKLQSVGNQLAAQQGAMSGGLGFGQNLQQSYMTPYMAPWQMMGAFGNVIGRPTILGQGSMSGSGKSKSKGLSL